MDSSQPPRKPRAADADHRRQPPRPDARALARERLLTQLTDARRQRCVILEGPAGSGKTTLLLAWRQQLLPFGFDVAWLTLGPEDNDLAQWLDDLVACLARVDPVLVREAALLAGRGTDEEAVERTLVTLVSSAGAFPRHLVLVLDDMHCATNPAIHETLQWLLDYAPANLHIVIASRGAVPVSLGRLRDQGLALELNMRDLRFTSAESEEFVTAQLGNVGAQAAKRLHELTDGWVAGLQLLTAHLKREKRSLTGGPMSTALSRSHLLDARGFAEYFEREVLTQLTHSEVSLLERLATCATFCASLCAAVAGDSEQRSAMLALLDRLESNNQFVESIQQSGGETSYRLNPLFRETLLQRFRTASAEQQRAVHLAVWQWFREHDQPDEAIRHALLAGETTAAADLVLQCAQQMRLKGDLRKLVGLMRLLPEDEIQARVGLRLWKARLQLYAHEYEACEASIASLGADIAPGDHLLRYRLAITQAILAVQRDDVETVAAVESHLLCAPDDCETVDVGGGKNILSWLYMHVGRFEHARDIQSRAAAHGVDGVPLLGSPAGSLYGRCIMGLSYSLEGKFVQAERICRDVLAQADQRGNEAVESACLAVALLGEVLYEFNELAAARQLLQERIEVLERVSIPDSVLRVLMILSAVHWEAGHRLDAFAWLDRLEEYGSKYRLDRLIAHSLAQRVQRHLQCGQTGEANVALMRLDALASAASSRTDALHAHIAVQAARANILWNMAHENHGEVSSRIHPLIEACEARGWQHLVAHFQLLGAIADARLGRDQSATEAVQAALRRGHRLGLMRTLLDADPQALEFIVRVSQEAPDDPLLSFYVGRLQAARLTTLSAPGAPGTPGVRSSARPAGVDGAAALSDREAEVLQLLAQALPNKRIARALAISPETVKWHLKNIYAKLHVSSRDEAVARIRDLGLGTNSIGVASSDNS
ncbi:LuxR C-terminal-related transcriptional regulator [Paraburkholderia sp. C35]|uniref:LuxR C-terminal-related transcriptional regulator n=1 Tax=Paraburkholderia sp. C35 TaxID=2126993 RepID=UPI000D694374|nr:LuxR C-terminal-related transcriptional regulator [Paraburkholderia sp. C35]